MKKTFSIGNLFKDAWADYKSNWVLFILVGVIFLIVMSLGFIGTTISPVTGEISNNQTISIVVGVLQAFIGLGYIKLLLNIVDNKEAKIEQLFNGATSGLHFIYYLVTGLLVSIATAVLVIPFVISLFIGLLSPVLAIIIGISIAVVMVMVTVGLLFSQYLVAEERAGIIESLKSSWKGTRKNQWKILWFIIVAGFFNLFGLLALGLGLIITIPMTALMYARLYRELFDCDCDNCVCDDDTCVDASCSYRDTESDEVDVSEEAGIIVEEILPEDKSGIK